MSLAEERALPIPPVIAEAAEIGTDVHELLRVWWDGRQPRMMIRTTFDDTANVGALLAEAAWHFSEAYAQRLGGNRDQIMADIVKGWTEQLARFDGPVINYTDVRADGASRS